jgi:hypothetical protein
MWGLTKNIYRFTPAMVVENLNQHTVDEVSQLSAQQSPQANGPANQSRRTLEHYQVLLQAAPESGGMV